MTPQQKLVRSLEIAERDHLTYRARMHDTNSQGERVFSVPSRSSVRYHIIRLTSHGEWLCGCAAAEHGLPCGHVGSAVHLWNMISRAMSEAGMRAQRNYDDFCSFLESRGY